MASSGLQPFNIDDGSGSIDIVDLAGDLTIDDGSGSIEVTDIDSDLIIVDDGSGSLKFSDIRGTVDADT